MFKKIFFASLAIIISTANLSAQVSNSSLLYLNIMNSARSVGMGGVSTLTVDPQSPITNPGAYGLFSFDNSFSLSIPNSTNWLTQIANDLQLKTWSIGAGYSNYRNSKTTDNKFHYSVGVALSRKTFEYGKVTLTDASGNPLSPIYPVDKTNFYTFSIGVDYKVRVGVGYTLKKFNSEIPILGPGQTTNRSDISGTLHDIGLLIELPIHKLLNYHSHSANKFSFEITPSFSIVKSNLGDAVLATNFNANGELPKIKKTGFGLNLNLTQNNKSIVNLFLVHEKEDDLNNEVETFKRNGIELSLLETVYFRQGNLSDNFDSDYDYSAYGFGFSLRGLLTAFNGSNRDISTTDAMGYIFKNIDVIFDWAKINQDNHPLDNTKFFKFSVTI